jgi:hypothetical protein
MPIDLVDNSAVFPTAIVAPEAGDDRLAESVAEGLQRLGDRTAFTIARLFGVERDIVRDYGAAFDGSDITAIVQTAVNECSTAFAGDGIVRRLRFPPVGRYGLSPSVASSWLMPIAGGTSEVHIAVHLKSGVEFLCDGAEFIPILPASNNVNWHYALFATPTLNTTPGTYKRIKFVKPRFDFSTTYWNEAHTNLMAVIAASVDDFEAVDPVVTRPTGTAGACGRLGKFINCRRLKIAKLEAFNVAQGAFFVFCEDVDVRAFVDGAHEGIDFDQVCRRVYCAATFTNGTGSEQQAVDIGSVQDGFFDIVVKNCGSAFNVYTKPEAANLTEWIANMPTGALSAAPVFSKRIEIHARGSAIHSNKWRSGQVSLYRDDVVWAGYWDGKDHVEDIKIVAAFDDCDPFIVHECINLDLDLSLSNVLTDVTDESNNAACVLRTAYTTANSRAQSKLSGRARVKVRGSGRAGVMVDAPTDFELEADVDGFNTAQSATACVGVWLRNLARKNGILTIKNIRARGGDPGVTPIDMSWVYEGTTGLTKICDAGGHRLASGGTALSVNNGSTAIELQGGAETLVSSIVTTAGNVDTSLRVCAKGGLRLVAAYAINLAAITGTSGTNYTSLSMRRIRAGVVSSAIGTDTPYDNVDRSAGTVVSLGVDGTDPDGIFIAGDIIAFRATQQAAGSSRSNILIKLVWAEYSL